MKIRRPVTDAIDAQQLAECVTSAAFERIQARIRATIEDCVKQLQTAETWDKSLRLQGMVGGLRTALLVPQILKHEGKEAK